MDPNSSGSFTWPSNRGEGLRRLHEFLPRAGRAYAAERNFDHGPGDRSNVSTLSPYIRHRLISEEEVISAVLERHGFGHAEKFLNEVCWRTYWKGWLELRPGVWKDYRSEVVESIAELDRNRTLRDHWEQATTGKTGIDCFDAWSRELVETGYLHNHARMWFAGIWIFTLRLPWTLGADFFYRHLLDGDPASNTLSWRWVAGLQTRGKTYLVRADNIERYTSARFRPGNTLSETAKPLNGPPLPRLRSLPLSEKCPSGPIGLLLTEEDLNPESFTFERAIVIAVAGILDVSLRSPLQVGNLPIAFTDQAMDDALQRASVAFGQSAERLNGSSWHDRILDWASRHGVREVVTPYVPQGPTRDRLDSIRESLADAGVKLTFLRRPWDDIFWPLAVNGFFPFKEKIPACLNNLGLMGGRLSES